MLLDAVSATRPKIIEHFAIHLLLAQMDIQTLYTLLLPICIQSPFARIGYVVHIPHRYYRLIRQSHRSPFWFPIRLYKESLPYGMVLADHETFPALIVELSYHVAVHTPMDSTGAHSYFCPIDTSLHPQMTDSTSILSLKCYQEGNLTTLQLSLYATTW